MQEPGMLLRGSRQARGAANVSIALGTAGVGDALLIPGNSLVCDEVVGTEVDSVGLELSYMNPLDNKYVGRLNSECTKASTLANSPAKTQQKMIRAYVAK